MSPRQRRLMADHAELAELAESEALSFNASGDPPDRYEMSIEVAGLERDSEGRAQIRDHHEFSLYLPVDYPRKPPAIAWRTPIFHPNILGPDRHGAVCLGSWAPGEGLADLCRRLMRMAAFQAFNLDDPLDKDAANWVRKVGLRPGGALGDVVPAAV